MRSRLQHPPSLVVAAAVLDPVMQAGLHEHAADLLSVAALDLLAEQARTHGRPEQAVRHAMESASLRAVLSAISGPDTVEACLAALRQRDLDLLAARLCAPAPAAAAHQPVARATPAA